MVAKELRSGRVIRMWVDELFALRQAPFPTDDSTLFVAYMVTAELSCFLQLGWSLPEAILDLYVEHKHVRNGFDEKPYYPSLLTALRWYGLPAIDCESKDSMRELAIREGDYSSEERQALLDYCETDANSLGLLLPKMLPHIDIPRSLVRGRYLTTVAHMEFNGLPVDLPLLERLRRNWTAIKSRLIAPVNAEYGVFDGPTFKRAKFEDWVRAQGISWPRTATGVLRTDSETFSEMAKCHPSVIMLKEALYTLGQLKLESMSVGQDSRNRVMMSPFGTVTSRCTPSNAKFLFGPSCWIRSLLTPDPGTALASIDFVSEEFAIAGALSRDTNILECYSAPDPYVRFGVLAKMLPENATKKTHPTERALLKNFILSSQFGMGSESLAMRLGCSPFQARELLRLHRSIFATYWKWSEGCLDFAMTKGYLYSTFGWRRNVRIEDSALSIGNFPVQANGGEILRWSCIYALARGVRLLATVHDSIIVEAPARQIENAVYVTQEAMGQASRLVLDGFTLKTEVTIVRSGERYMDPRGERLWETIMTLLVDVEEEDRGVAREPFIAVDEEP